MPDGPPGAVPLDQVPMYGGADRNAVPALKEADARLIADTTKEYGSREKAAAAFVDTGFRAYKADDLARAMRRFNQAWLLDEKNSEVYWGFATVLHDKGDYCGAQRMIERSLGLGFEAPAMLSDAGRIVALCALSDNALPTTERNRRLEQSDEFYRRSIAGKSDDPNTYASWATVNYWRGRYDDAWTMVAKQRALGLEPHPRFLSLLRAKAPEPR